MSARQTGHLMLLALAAALLLLLNSLIANNEASASDKPLLVYSELSEDLSRALLQEFQEKSGKKFEYRLLDTMPVAGAEVKRPDIFLASRETLTELAAAGALLKDARADDDGRPAYLAGEEGTWTGFCYDPCVFLVNHAFSRKIGQKNLLSWNDLAGRDNMSVSMEDLGSTEETKNFLAAFASKRGEEATMAFLNIIDRKIVQYAKFPISPIRLVTIGEADIAVTTRNKVIKYIEYNFPAYVVMPEEGAPAIVYGCGLSAASSQPKLGSEFSAWLSSSPEAPVAAEKAGYGYLFFSNTSEPSERVWVNLNYRSAVKKAALLDKWLQNVRFAAK